MPVVDQPATPESRHPARTTPHAVAAQRSEVQHPTPEVTSSSAFRGLVEGYHLLQEVKALEDRRQAFPDEVRPVELGSGFEDRRFAAMRGATELQNSPLLSKHERINLIMGYSALSRASLWKFIGDMDSVDHSMLDMGITGLRRVINTLAR